MIRKEYQIAVVSQPQKESQNDDSTIKNELLKILEIAFQKGAIVELKILEGVDLLNEGKRFSKLRMDIVSNTDFDEYTL